MSEDKQVVAKPFSYHTFVFPFIWNDGGKVTREQFEKCKHPCWVKDERQDKPFDSGLYAQYCYFNQAARNVIFTENGDQNPIVSNYRFDAGKLGGKEAWLKESEGKNGAAWLKESKGKDNAVRYVIQKDIYRYESEEKPHVFDRTFIANLGVNGIRLRLFSTGVGMIVFELENYDHNTEQEINEINEFGRRVFMPYVDEYGGCKLCADTITLKYPGGEIVSTISGDKLESNSDIRFMELILHLLCNEKYAATTSVKKDANQFYIEPIIDDRMFVACAWENDEFSQKMKEKMADGYRYLTDAQYMELEDPANLAGRLYEFVFVDATGLSCQSKDMLSQMLRDHVYSRGIEYGTATGISEYSMVTVTNFVPNITAFLTEYVEMAMLVLAQRASLLAFERQISDCARGKARVDKIQRAYVQFQSKYLLREVTPQQQGIELYKMLLEKLFIDNMQHDVENQINALFALERDAIDGDDNVLLFALAVLGAVEVVDYLTSDPGWLSLVASAATAVGLTALFLRNHRNRMK